LPELGKTSASKAHRAGVAERLAAAAGHKTLAGALALLPSDETLRTALALSILQTAQHHAPHTLSRRPTVPGMGTSLSLGWLYAMHPLDRLASVHALASDARLVTGSQEAGGNRLGTSGTKSGPAPLQWAFAAAAPLFLRHTPQGPKLLARVEQKHEKGTARRLLAHPLGRAVSVRRKRQVACARELFLPTSGSSAGEPGAERDAEGLRLARACSRPSPAASWPAKARRGRVALRPRA